jgi:hypothetical protein
MKILNWLSALALCTLVAACGGSGNAGTSPFGNGGGTGCGSASAPSGNCSSAAAIDVLASGTQVGSGGDTVTITAVVKGAGNVGLASVPVAFAVDTGTLTNAATITGATGTATATFSAGANRANRMATVTVTSGSAVGKLQLQIVGTALSYSGVTTVPLGGAVPVTVKAVDSTGAVISGLSVAVASALGNGLSTAAVTTDASGTASLTYTATNAGSDTLSFTGGGTTVAPTLLVSAANFTITSPAANVQIPVNTNQAVTVTYMLNGAAQANQTVTFTSTAGSVVPSSTTTNAQGQATVTVSSTTASPAVIQASLANNSAQATLPVQFVAQTPNKVVLQITPTAIGPNPAGATAQQAQLRATVTDANANPVTGATVNFNRVADPSAGSLSQASAVTDTSGQASVQYIAGALTTANGGVIIQANVVPSSGPTIFSNTATLTVNQSALFISLATGNTISNADPETYQKDYVVYVTDANGVAVPNINVTMSVLPTRYGKGTLNFSGGSWVYATVVFCQNEDATFDGTANQAFAFNGILDPGEDFNGNGRLDPGNVVIVSPGNVKTDATGRAIVSLFYGESYAPWVEVQLKAQAVVSGTESSRSVTFTVGGAAADFTSPTNPPAGVVSPFGVNACNQPN